MALSAAITMPSLIFTETMMLICNALDQYSGYGKCLISCEHFELTSEIEFQLPQIPVADVLNICQNVKKIGVLLRDFLPLLLPLLCRENPCSRSMCRALLTVAYGDERVFEFDFVETSDHGQ